MILNLTFLMAWSYAAVLDEVDAAREEVVKSVENVIESLSQTLGCSETSGAYQGLKSSMCCDTVGAAYFTSHHSTGWLGRFCFAAAPLRFCPKEILPRGEPHVVLENQQCSRIWLAEIQLQVYSNARQDQDEG